MRYTVGVDGCPAGWVAVTLHEQLEQGWACALHPSMVSVWAASYEAAQVWVDIPIGLPEAGTRTVEAACRAVLGARRSSVFNTPARLAAYAPDYHTANACQRELTGKGLSVQSWGIAPKIREVDGLLRSDPSIAATLHESHPEVVFWALNNRRPMNYNKKTPAGRAERMIVLSRWYPPAREVLAYAAAHFPRKYCGLDDVVDALCLAVGARVGQMATLPPTPVRDAYGLPMQVVYPVE